MNAKFKTKRRKYDTLQRLGITYILYAWFLSAQSAILGAMIGMTGNKPVIFENDELFYASWFKGNHNFALRAHMDPMFRGFYMGITCLCLSYIVIDPFPWWLHYFALHSIIFTAFIKDNVQTTVAFVGGQFKCFPHYTMGQPFSMFGTSAHWYLCKSSSIIGMWYLFHMVIYSGIISILNFMHIYFDVDFRSWKRKSEQEIKLKVFRHDKT